MIKEWQTMLSEQSVFYLKTAIVLWAFFVIFLVLFFVDNPWVLAGIFLYEVLP